MPFDVDSARKSGYSDGEIAAFLGARVGFDVDTATKAGYDPSEIVGFLSARANKVGSRGPAGPDDDPLARPLTPESSAPSSGATTFTATAAQNQPTGSAIFDKLAAAAPERPDAVSPTKNLQAMRDAKPEVRGSVMFDYGRRQEAIDDMIAAAQARADYQRSKQPEASAENVAAGARASMALSAMKTVQGLRLEYADATGDTPSAEEAKRFIKLANTWEQQATPRFDSKTGEMLYHGLVGFTNSAPMLAAGALNPVAGVALFTAQAQASGYGKYRERGAKPLEALSGANLEGAVMAGTSYLPVKFIADRIGKVGVGEFVSGLVARDVPTMVAQGVATDLIDTSVANPNKTFGDFLHEQPEHIAQSIVSALVFSSAMTGAHATGRAISSRVESPSAQFGRAFGQDVETGQWTTPTEQAAPREAGFTPNPNLAHIEPKSTASDVLKTSSVDEAIRTANEAVNAGDDNPAELMRAIRPLETRDPAAADALDLGSERASVEPTAIEPAPRVEPPLPDAEAEAPRGAIRFEANPTGTITAFGDPQGLGKILKGAGITSFIPSKDGVLIGKSQAQAARVVLSDFSAEPPKPVAPVIETAKAAEPHQPETSVTWYGRAGDGYATPQDAQAALPSRQKVRPELQWRIEQMPSGKYQLAGYGEQAAPSAGPAAPRSQPQPERSVLRAFLRRVGIAPELAADIAGDRGFRNHSIMPRTFRQGGLQLDELTAAAHEMGFLTDTDMEDSVMASRKFVEMVQAELRGDRQLPVQDIEERAAQELERRRQDAEAEARSLQLSPDELADTGYTDAPPEVRDRVRELVQGARERVGEMLVRAELAGIDTEALLEDVAKITENAPEHDYYLALEEHVDAALARAGEAGSHDRGAGARETGAEARPASQGPGELTAADRRAREEALQAENRQLNEEMRAAQAKDTGYRVPDDVAVALRGLGVKPTNTHKDTEWHRPVNDNGGGLGDVWVNFDPKTDRATVIAEYMGLEQDRREAQGAAAIREAVERARDGILQGEQRMVRERIAKTRGMPGVETHALAAPSKGDILAQQERRAQGERGEASRRADEDARAAADAELPDFTLTGSNRAVDEAEARGQQGLLAHGDEGLSAEGRLRKAFGGDGAAMPRSDVEKAVDELTAGWGDNKPKIRFGLPPEAPVGARGYYRDGQAWINPQAHRTRDQVARTLAHEAIAHHGLEGILTAQQWQRFMQAQDFALKAGNKPLAEIAGYVDRVYGALSAKERAHEIAARAIEQAVDPKTGTFRPAFGWLKSVWAHVADWLRSMGLRVPFSVSELHGMLVNAQRHLEGGKRLQGGGEVALAASREQPTLEKQTPASMSGEREEPGSIRPIAGAAPSEDGSVIVPPKDKSGMAALAEPDDAAGSLRERTPYNGPGAKLLTTSSGFTHALLHEALVATVPMEAGTQKAQAIAQRFANSLRVAQTQWKMIDETIVSRFTIERRRKMWEAADEENVERQRLAADPEYQRPEGVGLERLNARERATVEMLHAYGEELLQRAKDVGMFEGEGLPYWAPRMAVMIGEDGEVARMPQQAAGPKMFTDGSARNVTTTSPNLKRRKYLTAEETEAAAGALAREKGGKGAQLVRDIRTMPMAMARLERAIAGRELINQVKGIGLATGEDIVSSTLKPGFVQVAHPAFTTYRPRFVTDEQGKVVAASDQNGDVLFDAVPLFIRRDFEGPLKAVLSTNDGVWYSSAMLLKSKSMSAIMISPMIHNMVIWGRALAYAPMKVGSTYLYWKGNALSGDVEFVRQAVKDGVVPIGFNKTTVMDATDLATNVEKLGRWGDPNESWISLSMEKLGNALNEGWGDSAKKGIDAAGDFWHHTLLWKQIQSLQWGIYADAREHLSSKGFSDEAAGTMAAHFANRYAGVVARENQSEMARKAMNLLLFSRSFNITNVGVWRDAIMGLPAGLKAKLADAAVSNNEVGRANWQVRRKAWAALSLDLGFALIATSLVQNLVNHIYKDESLDDIAKGYVDRLQAMVTRMGDKPTEPSSWNPYRLSSSWQNEVGKKDRIDFGPEVGDRHAYMLLPTGKAIEDIIGWVFHPGETLEKKLSPLAKSLWETARNDKGFGVPVRDPNGSALKVLWESVEHIVESQVPWDNMKNLYDVVRGYGSDLDKKKLLGNVTGFTFSQGHPSGAEAAVNAQTQERFEAARKYTMQMVKDDLKRGDEEAATKKMEEIGMTQREINDAIERVRAPKSGISSKARRKFDRRANDQEREEMDMKR